MPIHKPASVIVETPTLRLVARERSKETLVVLERRAKDALDADIWVPVDSRGIPECDVTVRNEDSLFTRVRLLLDTVERQRVALEMKQNEVVALVTIAKSSDALRESQRRDALSVELDRPADHPPVADGSGHP